MNERVRSVWDNVDRTADPNWYRNYLDAFNAMETVRAWKQRSFGMLAIGPGHHVLDVGCGLGGDAVALAEQVGSGGRVVGVDNSEKLILDAAAARDGISVAGRVSRWGHLRAAVCGSFFRRLPRRSRLPASRPPG